MIKKRYRSNINVREPSNYFEKWYADMWLQRIPGSSVPQWIFNNILNEELFKVGAIASNLSGAYIHVEFSNDSDYTMFKLRWS
jgi:hypothetical protein